MPTDVLSPEMLTCRQLSHLARAMLVRFPDDYLVTGFLLNARITHRCLEGHLYKDRWRWHVDGVWITTAEIAELTERYGRWVIRTMDGEIYVVADFHAHGGRKSLRYLVEQFDSAAQTGSLWCVH
ncbi:hypothetical protein KRX52_06205 [Pseudomonas sp. MAP12]|uniref:Uncharacterized protein n=1 Tax=Geopseudomonas aromaticivorans TaxID=2849492 RepID=A0ABS6MVF8_9GAMM|nr:hypothetical protein [Pseudomonas aromaticivorans]MBV2132394.1 hypothetical protein [Pseudomonas aromaticivorans]